MSYPILEEEVWNLLDDEAKVKYYLWRKDKGQYAEKPAIIVCTGIGLAPDHKRGEWFTVYFGHGIDHWNAKNLKQAKLKAEAVLQQYTSKVKMIDDRNREYRLDLKRGFSINTICREDNPK